MCVDAFATTSHATCVGKTLQKLDVGQLADGQLFLTVTVMVTVTRNFGH